MKKAFILLSLLIIIACSIFTCSTLVFAEEYDKNIFYEAKSNIEVYYENQDTPIIIPHTYYFKITGSNENYINISYNGENLLLKKTDFETKVNKTSLTEVVSPYYNVEIPDINGKKELFFTLSNDASSIEIELKDVKFIGYTTYEGTHYLFIKTTIGPNPSYVYIKANDIFENYDPSKIALHPNSKESKDKIKEEETRVAQNKLKRNIFFAFIIVLCLLVTVLIYNPFRKKGAQKTPANFTSEDDF